MGLTSRPMYVDEQVTVGVDVERIVNNPPCQDNVGDFRFITID